MHTRCCSLLLLACPFWRKLLLCSKIACGQQTTNLDRRHDPTCNLDRRQVVPPRPQAMHYSLLPYKGISFYCTVPRLPYFFGSLSLGVRPEPILFQWHSFMLQCALRKAECSMATSIRLPSSRPTSSPLQLAGTCLIPLNESQCQCQGE